MLNLIREKLKTWVVVILVVLVAIPLIFLGVGDYGTNQEQYAFKVNDQEISRSVILQEMAQFKDVLRKNYQGSIPPVYTDQFIKKITFDNLIRRSIENNISSNIGLVLSDESIINTIKNTSSFKDEDGFNPTLYKKRLFLINMNPEVYEQYIYQKGIRDQLRKSITDSSFVSIIDKKLNINANYHKKSGQLLVLYADDIKKNINISLDEINNYYEENKNSFMSSEEAEFVYLRLNKKSIISSIEFSEDELKNIYQDNLNSGIYNQDILYEINHIVFPVNNNKPSVVQEATEAYNKILSDVTFSYISENYNVSDDTKNNAGYLGKMTLNELPDVIKSSIEKMKDNEVKIIISESNAVHIFKLINTTEPEPKSFQQVKLSIKDKLSNSKGSEKYFAMLDSIKEKIYTKNISLLDISKTYNLAYYKTPRIDSTYKNDILSLDTVTKLFSKVSSQSIYPPIYISNDDVLFVEKINYYPPQQLTLKDAESAINALLLTQATRKQLNNIANKKLSSLNSGDATDYENFSVYKYDEVYNEEIMSLINNQTVSTKFISNKTKSGDFVFIKINEIDTEFIDQQQIDKDNYLDYLRNTQSESDYNSFYISKYDTFDININEDYLNQ